MVYCDVVEDEKKEITTVVATFWSHFGTRPFKSIYE